MTVTDQRPDPKSVNPQYVAQIAQQRAGELYQDVILRDGKIREQQEYIQTLETRVEELEKSASNARSARPRHTDQPAEPAPQAG